MTGVYPQGHFLEELQTNLTRTYLVNSMAERKALMLELADAWLALPGGFGTLDEFFDALCLLQIRNHRKPCGGNPGFPPNPAPEPDLHKSSFHLGVSVSEIR